MAGPAAFGPFGRSRFMLAPHIRRRQQGKGSGTWNGGRIVKLRTLLLAIAVAVLSACAIPSATDEQRPCSQLLAQPADPFFSLPPDQQTAQLKARTSHVTPFSLPGILMLGIESNQRDSCKAHPEMTVHDAVMMTGGY